MTPRIVTLQRTTRETQIALTLDLDPQALGEIDISTGIGFFDHMLTALCRHAKLSLQLKCQGDLHIDDHHTVEDCGLVIGQALHQALGDRAGINRFGYAYAPLDEALARAVIDLSGRPFAVLDLGLVRPHLGTLACENISHFLHALTMEARMALHVDVLRGENDHHRAEAAFKAIALALKQAIARDGSDQIPSTKGVL